MYKLLGFVALAGILLVIISAHAAEAHDVWYNGNEVDPITKRVCCGQADAKMLDPSEVHMVAGGYKLDETGEVIPYDRAQPSVDGRYWRFYWAGQTQCFFAPFQGT